MEDATYDALDILSKKSREVWSGLETCIVMQPYRPYQLYREARIAAWAWVKLYDAWWHVSGQDPHHE